MNSQPLLKVVLVEDDDALGPALAAALQLEGMDVSICKGAAAALDAIAGDFPGVIVSDVRLPGMDGIALFAHVRQLDPDLPVILMTGHGDVAMAVAAMKDGAADFLTKPFSSSELIRSITVAAERRRLILENRSLREALKRQAQMAFLGSSDFAVRLRGTLSAVAQTEVDVIVEGAAGTGKTFVARLIHDLGPRHNRPFIAVDAGTLAHHDAEILLFGREQGRSGLSRTGLIERANGGTLLIDEVDSASPALQARLLSALATRSILPAGAERPRKLNICVVVTRLLKDGSDFARREVSPFHQRLSAITLSLISLNQRRQDIPALFHHFLARSEKQLGLPQRPVTDAIWQYFQTHEWAGNVRELEAFAQSWAIGLNVPDKTAAQPLHGRPLHQAMAEFERVVLENALRTYGGNVLRVGQALETPPKTLYDRLRRHSLRPKDFRHNNAPWSG